jgi:hypothetical protein
MRSATWGDYDGDGDPDLYLAGGNDFGTIETLKNRLYRNDGSGFTDMSGFLIGSSVAHLANTRAAAWVDYDTNGVLDLYLAIDDQPIPPDYGSPNVLFKNNGSGINDQFTNVAQAAGVDDSSRTRAAAWCDFNDDRCPDLYLANYEIGSNRLYQNNGDGTFTDVTSGPLGSKGDCTDAVWGYYNDDAYPDLYVTRSTAFDAGDNQLFENQGPPSWDFVDVTPSALKMEGNSTSATWGDFDNDGLIDLFVTNLGIGNRRVRNAGDIGGQWVWYDASILPIYHTDNGRTVVLGELDYSTGWGLLDCFLAMDSPDSNQMFEALPAGCPPPPAPARASTQSSIVFNNWFHVSLSAAQSNTSSIGARVELTAGGTTQIREIESYTGNSQTASFGLGSVSRVDTLTIRWPSGAVQSGHGIVSNRRLVVIEGDSIVTSAPEAVEHPRVDMLHQNFPNPFNPTTTIQYDIAQPGRVTLRIYDVSGALVRVLEGRYRSPGRYRVDWNGQNDRGDQVASGVYFCRLVVSGYAHTRKMVVLK